MNGYARKDRRRMSGIEVSEKFVRLEDDRT